MQQGREARLLQPIGCTLSQYAILEAAATQRNPGLAGKVRDLDD